MHQNRDEENNQQNKAYIKLQRSVIMNETIQLIKSTRLHACYNRCISLDNLIVW